MKNGVIYINVDIFKFMNIETIHHELFHVIDYYIGDKYDKDFKKLNEKGFDYTNDVLIDENG